MNKIPMKTFYTYDVPDTKQLVRAMRIAIGVSYFLIVIAVIWGIIAHNKIPISMCLVFLSICLILAFRPLVNELENKIKNETIVANEWGLEFYNTGAKIDIPWAKIIMVAPKNKSALFIKLKEYRIILREERKKKDLNSSMADKIKENTEEAIPTRIEDSSNYISFFSSLENVDFLVNFIEKNIKRIAEESTNVEMLNKPKSHDPLAGILKGQKQ